MNNKLQYVTYDMISEVQHRHVCFSRMLVQNTNLKYQVQDAVTYLTDSVSQMFKLHMTTNIFYKQKIDCNDPPPVTPPAELSLLTPCMIDFEFSPYTQDLYMHV